jgi:hypothetical protein
VDGTLEFIDQEMVHLGPGTYHWVSIKRFRIESELTDGELLEALLSHQQYHDHYAGQPVAEQAQKDIHGPYRLDKIDVDSFVCADPDRASALILEWAAEADPDPMPSDVRERLEARVLPILASGVIYELPDLRATAQHDWGWVVGQSGFHEFISIDRGSAALTVVVASDD